MGGLMSCRSLQCAKCRISIWELANLSNNHHPICASTQLHVKILYISFGELQNEFVETTPEMLNHPLQ